MLIWLHRYSIYVLMFCSVFSQASANSEIQLTATEIVVKSIDLWRGKTSYTDTEMIIHRPDWERKMKMRGWTRGMSDSLILFTYPKKDAGNANLKLGDDMWIFTPKLNRVTKLPASMMAQAWMGSDFSYNDLAKSDQVATQYTHTLLKTETLDGHKVYTIEAIPKEHAPIVWGKEIVKVRDDFIMLEDQFYDQSMELVKTLKTTEIKTFSGRPYPSIMRISRKDKPGNWTQIQTSYAWFDIDVPDAIFTQGNLKRPRPWSPPEK